jgi:hypothetical protein
MAREAKDQPKVITRSTSRSTAETDDIVLRETQTTRLIFRPTLIGDNLKNPEALANGNFIFQKKGRIDRWEDVPAESLASLKAGEMRRLELHADELLKLVKTVTELYDLVRQHRIKFGKTEWIKSPESVLLRALLKSDDELREALDSKEAGLIARVVKVLVKVPSRALEQLEDLEAADLGNFSAILGAAKLSAFIRIYEANAANSDERFWQRTLQKNAWVVSQVFASPMVIVQGQAFVGGKSIDNTGGKLSDFAYKNELTRNLALVEIKTPATNLMETKPYREGVFAVTRELAGGVAQLLTQKSALMEAIATLQKASRLEGVEEFEAFSPRALLIAGSIGREELQGSMLRSFELFRNELREIELITFDELARKVKNLFALLADLPSDV